MLLHLFKCLLSTCCVSTLLDARDPSVFSDPVYPQALRLLLSGSLLTYMLQNPVIKFHIFNRLIDSIRHNYLTMFFRTHSFISIGDTIHSWFPSLSLEMAVLSLLVYLHFSVQLTQGPFLKLFSMVFTTYVISSSP